MPDPRNYYFELPNNMRPDPIAIPEILVSDIAWFNANRASSRIYDPVLGIEGVVIHATAGGSSGGALSWWRTNANSSSHWIVPGEQEDTHGKHVIAPVYEARAARHVRNDKSHPQINGGKKKINHWTLGIEIVNRQDLDNYQDPYSDWQVKMAADLVRYCWAKYPNLKWVFSHAAVDPVRRLDPGPQFPWQQFEALVLGQPTSLPRIAMASFDPIPGLDDRQGAQPCCG